MSGSDDSLTQRGRALEEVFFRSLDEKLLADLRAQESSTAARDNLIRQTGLKDPVLIEELVHQGISSEGIVALRLIPLVAVAWADREVTAEERATILNEAEKLGIETASVAYHLLEGWLKKAPDKELIDAWERHTKDVIGQLSESGRKAYAHELEREMTLVARSSGGILGIGSISDSEAQTIEKFKQALPK